MIRAFITIILPLLLPTFLYFLWVLALRRVAAGAAPTPEIPWLWLALIGIAAAAIVLLLVARYGGSAGLGHYVPPHAVDGKIVPGHLEPGHLEPDTRDPAVPAHP